jgi:transcriptional regulator with XRE-family HTH domain
MCMKLSEWLKENGLSQAEFARRIGVSPPALSRFITGARIPHATSILKIRDATDGKVDVNDWVVVKEKAPVKKSQDGRILPSIA